MAMALHMHLYITWVLRGIGIYLYMSAWCPCACIHVHASMCMHPCTCIHAHASMCMHMHTVEETNGHGRASVCILIGARGNRVVGVDLYRILALEVLVDQPATRTNVHDALAWIGVWLGVSAQALSAYIVA